jgi:hypothetical protein
LWQRNYYERIIRNEDELNRVREYILNNPARRAEDENNPVNVNEPQNLNHHKDIIFEDFPK